MKKNELIRIKWYCWPKGLSL